MITESTYQVTNLLSNEFFMLGTDFPTDLSNHTKRAWKTPPREIALTRLVRAEELGITYREYTLEILERGKYLWCGINTAHDAEFRSLGFPILNQALEIFPFSTS